MAKFLYTNGCSWTFGNGISEDPNFPTTHNYSTDLILARGYTWPAHLAKSLSCNVLNDSMGGGSNKRIVRKTCDFLMNYPKDQYNDLIVAIGWTTSERDEIFVDNNIAPRWFSFNAMQKFSDSTDATCFLPKDVLADIDAYQRLYITHIYDDKKNLDAFYHQVYLLSNLLENLKIKYIFFNSLSPMWSSDPIEYAKYTESMEKIKTQSIIVDETFSLFCNKNNLKISSCMHPMIDAHKIWANHLLDKLTMTYGDTL